MGKNTIICITMVIFVLYMLYTNLNKSTDEKQIDINNNMDNYILFYADWCSACKSFKPRWNQIKNNYSGKSNFIEVNSETLDSIMQGKQIEDIPLNLQKRIKNETNIQYIPTIYYLNGNNFESVDRMTFLNLFPLQ